MPASDATEDYSALGDFRRVTQSVQVQRTGATAVINLQRFQERDQACRSSGDSFNPNS
jgi:hypothetical protein